MQTLTLINKDPAALTECVSWYLKHLAKLSPLCLGCHSFRHPDDEHLVLSMLVACAVKSSSGILWLGLGVYEAALSFTVVGIAVLPHHLASVRGRVLRVCVHLPQLPEMTFTSEE